MSNDNVVQFPVLSETDKQYLQIEKQQKEIAEQQKRIAELLENDKDKN
jgi:hypothetical protein|tara:strand:- start:2210 stop:2353 length:144 start_codon:yes stop_codon:yes gene_type:complete